MDQQSSPNGEVMPGISMRNGPVEEDTPMKDVNANLANGAAKRKVRGSLNRPDYADAESNGDDDEPLVCLQPTSSTDHD